MLINALAAVCLGSGIPKVLEDYYSRLSKGAYVEFSAGRISPPGQKLVDYRLWIHGAAFRVESDDPVSGSKTVVSDGQRRLTILHKTKQYVFGSPVGFVRRGAPKPDESLGASMDDRFAVPAFVRQPDLGDSWKVEPDKVTLVWSDPNAPSYEWRFKDGALSSFTSVRNMHVQITYQVRVKGFDWGPPPVSKFALTPPPGYTEFIPV